MTSAAARASLSPRRRPQTRAARPEMIPNLFVLSSSGAVLIEKHWVGRVKRSVCDTFWEAAASAPALKDVPPVMALPRHYVLSTWRYGVFFVTAVPREVQPLMVFEAHHRVIDVLLQYFDGRVDAGAIRENFSTVYQLLDEMVDGGFPSTTEPNQLKEMIAPPSLGRKVLNAVTGKSAVKSSLHKGTQRIPWRNADVVHFNNEIYLDMVETVDCIVGPNGQTVSCEVFGDIRANCKLSGMPDITLTFQRPSLIDDASLHRCVRIVRFRNERVVSFIPPDGKFRLMSYRVRGITQLPIYVRPTVRTRGSTMSVSLQVGTTQTRGQTVENLVVHMPFPASTLSVSLHGSTGEVKSDPVTKESHWVIGRMGPKDRPATLEGTVTLPPDYSSAEKLTMRVDFLVKMLGFSGLEVDRVVFRNIKYKPFKGVRHVTKAGRVEIRCG